MGRVGVGVTAAVRSQHLDRDLGSHRPFRDGLRVDHLRHHDRIALCVLDRVSVRVVLRHLHRFLLDQGGSIVGLEVLDHTLRDQEQRGDQAKGQQQVVGEAHEIDPEIAHRFRRMPGDAAHERRRDGDADRRGKEIMAGQRDHLREIRHGRLAAVALPVGVGGEAGRGVEGEVVGQTREFLRVERKRSLQPQQGVGHQHGEEAEEQHRDGVLFPVLLRPGIHSAEAIGQALDGPEHLVEPGAAARIQDLQEVESERFGDEQEQPQVKGQLEPSEGSVHRELKIKGETEVSLRGQGRGVEGTRTSPARSWR